MSKNNQLSLFVVGLPRSGTKLLRELLNNHSEIFIPSIEAYFVPHLIKRYGDKKLGEEEAKKVMDEIRNSLFFFYYDNTELLDLKRLVKEHTTVKDILGELWQQMAQIQLGEKVQILGDKTPRNVFHLHTLMSAFPNAKFIHIVRDPRDNVLSAKNKWNKKIFRAAYNWQKAISNIDGMVDKTRFIEVKYEDLIKNTENVVKNLCQFIGISYQKGMERLKTNVENKGEVVDENNYNKFQDQLLAKEIIYIEALTKEGLQKYGYLLTNQEVEFKPNPSPLKKIIWKLSDSISLITYNISVHGLKGGVEKIVKAKRHA